MTNAAPIPVDEVSGGFSGVESAVPPLFRPEALAAATDRGAGQPIAALPFTWTTLTLLLGGMAIAFAILLLTGTYTRKESAAGIVRAVGGDVRVAPTEPGRIERVMVKEGQSVHAGDTLMTVSTARSSVDGRPADRAFLASLDSELENLQQRLRALDVASGIQRLEGPENLAALEGELAAIRSQETSGAERLRLAEVAHARVFPVAQRGFISAESMRRREDEIIALRQSISEARASEARLRGQIVTLRGTIAQRPMASAQDRGQLLDLIAKARRDRTEYAERGGYAIVAPKDGVVTALQAVKGQAVDPQSSLLNLSAPGAGVSAELFVPSRAIGFLERGQRVRVRYDAFPYQQFGTAEGTVTAISATVLKPQDVDAAIHVEEPVYRVLVRLRSTTVSAYGRTHRIRSGFALTADIELERQTFAKWLLDPVVSLRGRL